MPSRKHEGEEVDYWDWNYEKKPRREAKGGIKARSKRGAIGETWWSKRFIGILESFDIGARLARGRSYARSGQVMDLKIKPGLVTSKVQGSHREPYKVRIEIKPLSESDWSRAEEGMAGQAIFMAKLLAGEMPHEIEEAFAACDLKLLPNHKRDLETDCSCPDWSNPCKHIAATYYILAEKFDEDPFLIFAWRGRSKDHITERLRALRDSIPSQADPALDPQELIWAGDVAPLAGCIPNFWEPDADLSRLSIRPQAAGVPDAILKQLGPAPIEIGGKNLIDRLVPVYEVMTKAAAAKALDEL
jgi:uncharacterized Zn finger protein